MSAVLPVDASSKDRSSWLYHHPRVHTLCLKSAFTKYIPPFFHSNTFQFPLRCLAPLDVINFNFLLFRDKGSHAWLRIFDLAPQSSVICTTKVDHLLIHLEPPSLSTSLCVCLPQLMELIAGQIWLQEWENLPSEISFCERGYTQWPFDDTLHGSNFQLVVVGTIWDYSVWKQVKKKKKP